MTAQLMPVPFGGETVVLVYQDNEPYVAMKPIVTNIGLAWSPQRKKIAERFGSTVTEIVTVADDGSLREMTCLPLRKLAGWLYSISPNKVKPELRDKIIQYQEECDEVLWRYWMNGQKQYIAELEEQAARVLPLPGVKTSAREGINFKQALILQQQARDLARLLAAATNDIERHVLDNQLRQINDAQDLHRQLRRVNDALGVPTLPLQPDLVAIQRAEV